MSLLPEQTNWFPERLNAGQVATLSHVIIEVARQCGFTRETYAASIAQLAESIVGLSSEDDIDHEVLRFVGQRLRAASDAIERSAN